MQNDNLIRNIFDKGVLDIDVVRMIFYIRYEKSHSINIPKSSCKLGFSCK